MKAIIHPDYAHLSDFIREIPRIFPHEGELLYDKRNKVKRFIASGETLIVKKFKRPHLIQRIAYTFFRKSKAERAYLYAGMFREKGFDTPHEIAYLEQKAHGLFADGWFVSTECKEPSMKQLLQGKEDFDKPSADALARFLADLHRKGILHGDINLSNILYRVENGHYRFTLIDTNRSTFLTSPDKAACLENLKRLTHQKELLEYIVRKYAEARNWPPEECVSTVLRYLSAFEMKRQKKRKLRSVLGFKKK